MKIVLPGGSGQVGNILARAFARDGHDVVVLSRKPGSRWRTVLWDAENLDEWAKEVDGADVVINLAGRNVNCRYTPENRIDIKESRIRSTKVVGQAIAKALHPPRVWLQASTATIYTHRHDAPNDETTGMIGGSEPGAPDTWRFSIDVATSWEHALDAAIVPKTRKVKLRSAMTLSPDPDGVFDVLAGLVRKGLGGAAGDGKQYFSWVHEADFVRAIYWLIENEQVDGPVNISAPDPVPNAQFMRVLRRELGVPIGLPAAKWMLEVGAVFMKTETELVLKSRRVVPGRLLNAGFQFQFPTWPEAARELCQRWKRK